MSPEDVKALRKELNCTAKELATALKAEPEDIWAWEAGERFPTKRFVMKMQAMKKRRSIEAKKPALAPPDSDGPYARLADPEFWRLVRKLTRHDELWAATLKLAAKYDDPLER